MIRLTKAEKAAAMAVAGMTVTVAAAGIRLLRRHTRYMIRKAAAHFETDLEEADEETGEKAGEKVQSGSTDRENG